MTNFKYIFFVPFLCQIVCASYAQKRQEPRVISADYNGERGKLCKVFKECKSSALIRNLTLHFLERYGMDEAKTRYFEVWNEPDITAFSGSRQ